MYRANSILIYYISYLLSQLANLNLHSKRFFVNKMKTKQGEKMTISKLVTPIKHQTLSIDVYEQLKELIISGQLMPGEQLSLDGTAKALGISVMPVREATQRLVAEQALEIGARRTLQIPMMSVANFREITFIRMNLEGLAAEKACNNLSKAELSRIRELSEAFKNAMAKTQQDGARLIALNKKLHFAVYKGAQMPILVQLIEALWLRVGPILNYDLRSGSERLIRTNASDHHEKLVKALEVGNPKGAREALHSDIKHAAEFIISAGALVVADEALD